jgi:dihydrofolate reductase
MRKLVVTEFISLDGVIEAPGGEDDFPHGAWTIPFWSDAIGEFKDEELQAADISLLGRRTYDTFAGAWPDRSGDRFADKLNSMRKVVASNTLTDPEWENTDVVEGDLVEAVEALKAEDGGDILLAGSISIARQLLAAGVVDEVRLVQYPVVLGIGQRLFDEAGAHRLDLVSAVPADSGAVLLTYQRSAEPLGKPTFSEEAVGLD